MRGTIIAFSCGLALSSAAQTMQLSDAPQVGDHVRYAMLDGDPVLASGPGQQWTLDGAIEFVGDEVDFVAVAGASGASYFPLATLAAVQEAWPDGAAFFRITAAGLEVLGSYEPGNLGVFTDTDLWLPFPCAYGTTWTDGFTQVDGESGDTTDQALPTLWTADGYGSLTGPAGTLQNVLKCRTVRNDVTIVAGDTASVTILIDRFWKPGYPMYVAQVRRSTYETPGIPPFSSTTVEVVDELAVGLEDPATSPIGLELFPNPAHGDVSVVYAAQGAVSIRLLDALGREVRRANAAAGTPGIHRAAIDVRGLPSGRYLVRVIDGGGQSAVTALVVE